MTLNIELPAAVEHALLARAAAEGKDVATLVAEVVTERLAVPEEARPAIASPKGFAHRLQAWVELHPRTGQAIDDSRESIYAGRGQ